MPDLSNWPGDREDLIGLSEWIGAAVPGSPVVEGPVDLLRVKSWGVTAVFEVDGRSVVVKHTSPVLLDWEEARVGCPLLSLHRLLREGDEHGNTAEVLTAYLDAVPGDQRHLTEVALQLAPLELAIEAREYARVLHLPHPHTRYTTTLITRSLTRLRGDLPLPPDPRQMPTAPRTKSPAKRA